MGSRTERPGAGELKRWWQEHSELDELVEALVEATEHGTLAAASASVEELGEALEGHFAVEEEVYFPLVESLRPEYGPTVQTARLAHLEVREQLDRLRSHLSNGDPASARDVLNALLDIFRTHEEMEGRLIADLSTPGSR